MERVQEQKQTAEVFENDIQFYLFMFCEEQGIDDMKKESQAVWNSALRYIYKHVFRDKGILKQHSNIHNVNNPIESNYNSYDYAKVLEVVDIYIFDMCMRYDKEVSIIGFSTLTGIDQGVIYDWGNGSTKLSNASIQIYKKLTQFREESLSNKLVTGNKNPVGVIAVLNRQYGWASPYTADSNRQKRALSDADLPKIGSNTAKIEMKPQDIVHDDA